jgi:signal transduction histidine kinase
MPMPPANLPSPGNDSLATMPPGPLLRAYLRWAEPWYRRMPPDTEAWSRRVDLWLYGTRAGRWSVAAMLAALALTAAGLHQAGMPWWLASLVGLAVSFGLLGLLVGPWLKPEGINRRWLMRGMVIGPLLGLAGAATGALIAFALRDGGLAGMAVGPKLAQALWRAAPIVVAVIGAGMLLQWGVAQWRRHLLQQELRQLRLARERDAAALRMREAELRLLQAQVRPHFIFNTLAAVQHWVDTGDARAAPLLRSLTAFLRNATGQLGQPQVRLADEAATVGHYLQIMQARLGDRLRSHIDIDPVLADRLLPPGLLLTLVENAVEHGLSPTLAGGEVRVSARADAQGWTLVVHDDGAGLPPDWRDGDEAAEPADGARGAADDSGDMSTGRRGIGLMNCRARLAHHFGPAASLTLRAGLPGTHAEIHFSETTA